MYCLRQCLLAFLAVNLAGASRTAPQLKGSAQASLVPAKAEEGGEVRSKLQEALTSFALHAPAQTGAAQVASGKAPTGAAQKSAADQPVGVQVEEKVIEKLQSDLSPECRKRYSAMMAGKGPSMHSFNEHDADETSSQCKEKLQGNLCTSKARVSESVDAPDGRKMSQNIEVQGKSCLPKECTQQNDLQVLASFMHAQTKEMMPGEDVKVALHVDCTQSGGGLVDHPAPPRAVTKSGAPAAKFGLLVLLCAWMSF